MLPPLLAKNDSKARVFIGIVSFVIFTAIVILSRVELKVDLGFDVHIFALINAWINSLVSILLVLGLIAVRSRRFVLHKNIMIAAMIFSIAFLVSYISHHLLAGDTKFGDLNHDKELDAEELLAVGKTRLIYFIILITHIFLAATESRSGSTLKERNCTKAESSLLRGFFIFSAFCRPFIFIVSVGQIEGHLVKKKSAMITLSFRSSSETCSPNWFVSVMLDTRCHTVSVVLLPATTLLMTVSAKYLRGMLIAFSLNLSTSK